VGLGLRWGWSGFGGMVSDSQPWSIGQLFSQSVILSGWVCWTLSIGINFQPLLELALGHW
jgi:hypothetical protein